MSPSLVSSDCFPFREEKVARTVQCCASKRKKRALKKGYISEAFRLWGTFSPCFIACIVSWIAAEKCAACTVLDISGNCNSTIIRQAACFCKGLLCLHRWWWRLCHFEGDIHVQTIYDADMLPRALIKWWRCKLWLMAATRGYDLWWLAYEAQRTLLRWLPR